MNFMNSTRGIQTPNLDALAAKGIVSVQRRDGEWELLLDLVTLAAQAPQCGERRSGVLRIINRTGPCSGRCSVQSGMLMYVCCSVLWVAMRVLGLRLYVVVWPSGRLL